MRGKAFWYGMLSYVIAYLIFGWTGVLVWLLFNVMWWGIQR